MANCDRRCGYESRRKRALGAGGKNLRNVVIRPAVPRLVRMIARYGHIVGWERERTRQFEEKREDGYRRWIAAIHY